MSWLVSLKKSKLEDGKILAIDREQVAHVIELRHVYDGWSVAVMRDGSLRNRWEPGDRRWNPTQQWIENAIAEENE